MQRFIVLGCFAIFSLCSWAESDCYTLAKTDLETIYCQIAATPEARNLPSFSDFRRNGPQVQSMLLKSSARRLGIVLPEASVRKPAPTPVASRPTKPSSTSPAVEPVKPSSQSATPRTASSKPTPANVQTRDPLAGCKFLGEVIRCPNAVFHLTSNRQNRQLAPGVLSANNVLQLPPFNGNPKDTAAVNNYLADSYEQYISKMLLIGLGGSTMTYTKFHYTFWDLMEKGEDFASRVSQTYNYLKQDKASMVVKTRYDDQMPESIAWCQSLSATILVCDNSKKNWVYTSHSD